MPSRLPRGGFAFVGVVPRLSIPTTLNSPYRSMPERKRKVSEEGLIGLRCQQTFNHGVEGSSPSALTKQIKHLPIYREILENAVWAPCGQINCRARRDGARLRAWRGDRARSGGKEAAN